MNQPGSNYPPYRQPYSSGSNLVRTSWLGAFYSNGDSVMTESIQSYVTTVPPYSGSAPQLTYSRPAAQILIGCNSGTTACAGVPNSPPCSAWLGAYQGYSGSQEYTLVPGQLNSIPAAVWSQSYATVPAQCRLAGCKSVIANRMWHGALPFTCLDQFLTCPNTLTECTSGPYSGSIIGWLTYQSSPTQVKYLSLDVEASMYMKVIGDASIGSIANCSIGGSITIDGNSGEITSWPISTETNNYQNSGLPVSPITILYLVGGAGYEVPDAYAGTEVPILNGGSSMIDGLTLDAHCAYPQAPDFVSPFGESTSMDGIISDWNNFFPSNQIPSITNVNSYSTSVTAVNLDGESPFQQNTIMTIAFSRGDTVMTYAITLHQYWSNSPYWTSPDGSPYTDEIEYTFSQTLTLSSPNYASALVNDCYSMLSNWPLNDDKLYPWRTDATPQMAPLMSRNEYPVEVSPCDNGYAPYYMNDYTDPITDSNGNPPFYNNTSSGVAWVPTFGNRNYYDQKCYEWIYAGTGSASTVASLGLAKIYDGAVLGAPLPYNYENQFDFANENYRECNGGDYDEFDLFQYGMTPGQLNSMYGADLPLNATQIINNFNCIGLPPGGYMSYDDPTYIFNTNGVSPLRGLVVSKWAEIKEGWPSINFYLPAGQGSFNGYGGMFSLDESTVCCLGSGNASGSGGVAQTLDNNGNPYTIPNSSGLWGGPGVNGFYEITVSGSMVTLGAQSYNCPSNFFTPTLDTTTCFGRLRFVTSSVSLLGPQPFAFTGVLTGSYLTGSWSNPQPTFGMQYPTGSEYVDFMDRHYNVVASNVGPVTRIDDSTFTVVSGSYPHAVLIQIHGSPPYYALDTYSKGDYIYGTWMFDYRTNNEVERTSLITDCNGNPLTDTGSANNGYGTCVVAADAVGSTPCCPSILCFTPNGETWKNNSKVYDFPATGSFLLDSSYGSRWQGNFFTNTNDPFADGAHIPCGQDGVRIDNNGTCQQTNGDNPQITYYALPMQVEPRLSSPPGFPTLPVSLSWVSPQSNTGSNVLYPPGNIGYETGGGPAQAMLPFVLRGNLCNSIMGECSYNYSLAYPPC